MFSSVVLYSGGIDSIVLLEYVRRNIDPNTKPVYFNIQSRYSEYEIDYISTNERDIVIDGCLDLGDIERKDAFVPNRNIILATLAVSKYSKTVYIGGSKSDRVSDNNKECFDELSRYLTKIDGKEVVTITSPFWDYYKQDMVDWYIKNVKGGRHRLFNNSFSCYTPKIDKVKVPYAYSDDLSENPPQFEIDFRKDTEHCFKCKACLRRNVHLMTCGYLLPFYNDKLMNKIIKYFDSQMDDHRSISTSKYKSYIQLWKKAIGKEEYESGRN